MAFKGFLLHLTLRLALVGAAMVLVVLLRMRW